MKLGYLCIVALLSLSQLVGGQIALPLRMAMGDNLKNSQHNESYDTGSKIEISPPMSALDCLQSREPRHGWIFQTIFVAGVAFLVGFKVAVLMSRRQIFRLRRLLFERTR